MNLQGGLGAKTDSDATSTQTLSHPNTKVRRLSFPSYERLGGVGAAAEAKLRPAQFALGTFHLHGGLGN